MHIAKQINKATNTFFLGRGEVELTLPLLFSVLLCTAIVSVRSMRLQGCSYLSMMCNITFCFVLSKRETIRKLKRNSIWELQESFGWHYQRAFTKTAGGPSSVRLVSRQHKISKLQHTLLQTRRHGRYNKPDGQTLFSEVEEKTCKMWR